MNLYDIISYFIFNEDLKNKCKLSVLQKLNSDGYTSPSRGVEHASTELEKILSIVSFLALKDLHYFAFNSFEC
jgi:hypothetical protein